uniref:Uncharacterized protein n=1 Tax=Timema bartmani TaxID=61472 RepID=A0A7R9HWM2_9NEOP|nr:unnamed protein product [Timema bartmani]
MRNQVDDNSAPWLDDHGCFSERVFKLRLTPDTNIFADDVVFEGTKGAVDFDPRKAYIGTLEGKFSARRSVKQLSWLGVVLGRQLGTKMFLVQSTE